MSCQNAYTCQLLVLELRKDNKKAFRRLYDMYWENMYRKALIFVKDENVAKDIIQDIWITLWQQRSSLEIKSFEGYIFRAVRNGCYKYFRDKKFTTSQLNIIDKLPVINEPEIVKSHNLQHVQNRLKKALEELPNRRKRIFELSRLEQYTNEEIANELGISKRSVENQISLAVKALKQGLAILILFLSI